MKSASEVQFLPSRTKLDSEAPQLRRIVELSSAAKMAGITDKIIKEAQARAQGGTTGFFMGKKSSLEPRARFDFSTTALEKTRRMTQKVQKKGALGESNRIGDQLRRFSETRGRTSNDANPVPERQNL